MANDGRGRDEARRSDHVYFLPDVRLFNLLVLLNRRGTYWILASWNHEYHAERKLKLEISSNRLRSEHHV